MLLATVVFFVFLDLTGRLDKHWNTVRVARLYRLLKKLALFLHLTQLGTILFSLPLQALELANLTIGLCKLLLLLAEDLLVFTEPFDFILQLLDLAL